MTESIRAEVDPDNLREVLGAIKEFSPKLATGLRRELRGVGDSIIAGQHEILDGPLPSGIEQTGTRTSLGRNKKTGKVSLVKRAIYRDKETAGGKSTGMREAIKKGLKTRVVAGKTRQGINVRTTLKDGPMSLVWQSKQFRHKVWGREPWVLQRGQPYFFAPVMAGKERAREAAIESINRALAEISD